MASTGLGLQAGCARDGAPESEANAGAGLQIPAHAATATAATAAETLFAEDITPPSLGWVGLAPDDAVMLLRD